MRRIIRIICLILVAASVINMTAFASETTDSRASNYFASASAYFNVVSSTKFDIWFDVTAVGTMDELGASEIVLERSTDMVNWTTVKTYKRANYSQLVNTNASFTYSASVPYTYSDGYYYCATVTLYAKKGNGTASATVTSDILDLT